MRWIVSALCVAVAAASGVAACGSVRYLEAVAVTPPAGAKPVGVTGARRGTADPPSGQPLYRFEPEAGDAISYRVIVRGLVDYPITVVGVRGDPGNDGVLIPDRVEEAPVTLAPGGRATLTIGGRIGGCEYDGQRIVVRGPRLELRADGKEVDQQVALDKRIELIAPRRDECGDDSARDARPAWRRGTARSDIYPAEALEGGGGRLAPGDLVGLVRRSFRGYRPGPG